MKIKELDAQVFILQKNNIVLFSVLVMKRKECSIIKNIILILEGQKGKKNKNILSVKPISTIGIEDHGLKNNIYINITTVMQH